jgi:hypothetical protein
VLPEPPLSWPRITRGKGGAGNPLEADALAGVQARVVITTMQKFPFVLDVIGRSLCEWLDRREQDARAGRGLAR